jgi:hypothetical protein
MLTFDDIYHHSYLKKPMKTTKNHHLSSFCRLKTPLNIKENCLRSDHIMALNWGDSKVANLWFPYFIDFGGHPSVTPSARHLPRREAGLRLK